jgi:hypothetical protein
LPGPWFRANKGRRGQFQNDLARVLGQGAVSKSGEHVCLKIHRIVDPFREDVLAAAKRIGACQSSLGKKVQVTVGKFNICALLDEAGIASPER